MLIAMRLKQRKLKSETLPTRILGRPAFSYVTSKTEMQLVLVSASELGVDTKSNLSDVYILAKGLGLTLCPGEVGPQLRLDYRDQPIGEVLDIAMEPVATYSGDLAILSLINFGQGLALIGGDGRSDIIVSRTRRFVFALPAGQGMERSVSFAIGNRRELTMMVKLVSLVLSSVAFFATVLGLNAQNLPAEGPLSISFTATQIPPAKPMPIGGGKEFVVLNMAMTASNDTGNSVLHNMGGRCQFAPALSTQRRRQSNNTVFAPTPTMTAIKSSNNATFFLVLRTTVN